VTRPVFIGDLAKPDLIPGTEFTGTLFNDHRQKGAITAKVSRHDCVVWRGKRFSARCGQPGDDLWLRGLFAAHQQLRLNPQSGGNSVHPHQRQIAHPGFEPADGLRRGGWGAAGGDIGKGQALLASNVANTVYHGRPFANQFGFSLSYSQPNLASPNRRSIRRTKGNTMQRQLVERELSIEGPVAGQPRRGGRSATVNIAESPVTWLHARGHLSDRQFLAGEKLRADWERSGLSPGVTMRWDPVRTRGTGDSGLLPGERSLAARQRFDGAIGAAGSGLSDILWRVVCAGEALVAAEKALDWPTRSGKLVLRLALDRVADFYRIG
jgi:hypothetical protein